MESINNVSSLLARCATQEAPVAKKPDAPERTKNSERIEKKPVENSNRVAPSMPQMAGPVAPMDSSGMQGILQVVLGFATQLIDRMVGIFEQLIGRGQEGQVTAAVPYSQQAVGAAQEDTGGGFLSSLGSIVGGLFGGDNGSSSLGSIVSGLFGGGDKVPDASAATSGSSSSGWLSGIMGMLGGLIGKK